MESKRIVIATIGSLGDLHPAMALALELQARGHQIILATSAVTVHSPLKSDRVLYNCGLTIILVLNLRYF